MNSFWRAAQQDVGGPLTEEALLVAMEAMLEQQAAYYREIPPPCIYPASLVRKDRDRE